MLLSLSFSLSLSLSLSLLPSHGFLRVWCCCFGEDIRFCLLTFEVMYLFQLKLANIKSNIQTNFHMSNLLISKTPLVSMWSFIPKHLALYFIAFRPRLYQTWLSRKLSCIFSFLWEVFCKFYHCLCRKQNQKQGTTEKGLCLYFIAARHFFLSLFQSCLQ